MEISNSSLKILTKTLEILTKILQAYFDFIFRTLNLRLVVSTKSGKFGFTIDPLKERTIDERIANIEIAKENLLEALSAMDDMQKTAENQKKELERINSLLEKIQKQKRSAKKELIEIKKITGVDVETFRKIAKIPSKKDIWGERMVGFISGIVASAIVGVIFIVVPALIK
ncbi:MAG: hypothetical protein IIA70_00845 [Proteobacteria bacterium]|nr:hypothetical protein [Pseudomonadota bacterium]